MQPDHLVRPIRWDPVFRSTFLCFHPAIAEDARIFGHLVDDMMCEAHLLGPGAYGPSALRAVAHELLHLDRFIAFARLDLVAARRRIGSFVQLISKALEEEIRPKRKTPAFRESFLVCLPEKTQRAARSFGAHLYGALTLPLARTKPQEALQGAIDELDYLTGQLEQMERDVEQSSLDKEEERLDRFAGRMAKRVEALSQAIAKQAIGQRR